MPFWSRGSESKSSTSEEKDFSPGENLTAFSTPATASVGVDDGALLSQSPPATPQESNTPAASISVVSEPWTRIFPQVWGIRQSIEDSSFRWCVRESMLWGVATGTMMGV